VTTNVYLEFIRRWFWLICAGILIAVVATNSALAQRIPLYQSTATVQVGRSVQDASPEASSMSISQQLVPVYIQLAKRDPVLNTVSETLGIPYSADFLRSRLLISPVPGTQLIDIKVIDADPQLAASIANEIARQMVLQSPGDPKEEETQLFIQSQLTDLQTKIENGQAEIEELEEKIGSSTSAAEVAETRLRLESLQAQVNAWQQSYVALVASSEPSKTNVLAVVNQATPALAPIPAPTIMYYGLGVIIGGGTAAALALGISTFFHSIRRADDLRGVVDGVPVTTIPYLRDIRRHPLVSSSIPASPTAASYRMLRNVLQTGQSDASPISIAVISGRPGEGKTTTVANLAIVLSSIRRSVILVDANVRNPCLDQMFATDTSRGLSDVLLGDCELADALQPTAYPNLTILGAGSIPGNYTDILSPSGARMVVEAVTEMAEIILIDTPSIWEEQEALLVAKAADAAIVVVEAGRVRASEVERTLEILNRSGVQVISIALNKARTSSRFLDRLPFSRDARRRKIGDSRRLARSQPDHILSAKGTQSTSTVERLNNSRRLKNARKSAHVTADADRSESA